MVVRSLFLFFLISACCCCLNAQNLIVNPDFEATTHEANFPDYWARCLDDYFLINSNEGINNSKCIKFYNGSGSEVTRYFYSNYLIDHSTPNYINAMTGETYEFSVQYKTDTYFTGDTAGYYGISIQLFFNDGTNIVGNVDTPYQTSSNTWKTLKIRGTVQGTVNKISAGINCRGKGIAWVDCAQLIKINEPLCKNGGFETDTAAPADKPDYFMPRSSTLAYHHVETSSLNSYLGYNAALFNNTGAADACYYYGLYDAAGSASNYISVCPGDSYTISGMGRADPAFIGSYGVRLSLIFWNDSNYVDRVDSSYTKSTDWTPLTQDGTVPAGANKMSYSVEYSGQNKAWVDEVRLVPKNLVKNSSFETDTASPSDKPDYFMPRSTTLSYHHVDSTVAYQGGKSAQFNNTSGASDACYYYGPADAASSAVQYMDAIPGEIYTFSAYGKVDSNFTGSGVRVSIIFMNDATYVDRVDSSWQTPANWTKMSVQATVPATGVNKMFYSIEYTGRNKAWVDRAELSKTDPWYYQAAPLASLESLTFTPPAKVSYASMQNNFYAYHDALQLVYNGDGSWNNGYGVATNDYPNGHPLIRSSANAVIGYLRAYNKIDSAHQTIARARALAGLEWLLTQQNANGSFSWWNANPPTVSGGAELYEGGIAVEALIKGYEFFGDSRYLTAAINGCNYFVNSVPTANANANFTAFAISGLVAGYSRTGTQAYLNQALIYLNTILSFQLDSGMWSDDHNQYIYYHGIITKSMVEILQMLEYSNPKRKVISQAMYKALNHIRRMQNNSPYDPTVGVMREHPVHGGIVYDAMSTMAVTKAYSFQGIASDSLDTLTEGAQWITKDTVGVFGFAALGTLLELYY